VIATMPHAPIFVDGLIASWNPRSGVGSVSLDGSTTRIPFGRSAVDDSERDRVRPGRRCRFALDEARSSNGGVRVAKLVPEK
jgi:hypothetical protein